MCLPHMLHVGHHHGGQPTPASAAGVARLLKLQAQLPTPASAAGVARLLKLQAQLCL